MAVARSYTTRDPTRLSKALVLSLYFYLAAGVVSILANALQIGSLAQMRQGDSMSLFESTVGWSAPLE